MALDDFLKASSCETNAELEKFFPKKISKKWVSTYLGDTVFGFDLAASQKSVVDPIWDFLDRGGKRWRPALMLLSCEAVGGNSKEIKEFTVLPELIHTGTIIVDDVEDNSLLRRGKPALHKIYGEDVAVNAGNLLYFLPLKLVEKFLESKNKGFEEKANKIYSIYVDELVKLSFGQAMDIQWHQGNADVLEADYLQMCSYKTGSLARFAAKLGAVLGNANAEQIRVFGDFAESIGVAFQIQDDILNLKPSKDWGKEIGDDIKEGKRTLIVIHSLKQLSSSKKKRLLEILDSPDNSEKDVLEAISLLDSTDSFEYAKKIAVGLVEKSWNKLDKQIKDSESKVLLKGFADYLVERSL